MPLKTPIYMDHHATTPVDPRVVQAMMPYFTETFGNAASIDHLHGHAAQEAVESSREVIARFIGARAPEEIIFTSGATESDNIALAGVVEAYGRKGNHIITSAVEHKAVLDTLEYLGGKGVQVTVLPVDRYGMVCPADVRKAITDKTILVSIMMANNEVGTIQPITEIGQIAKERGIFFHTDAAQAVGHVPVDVEEMNIDLMSFTAHKIYGPKGIGALYVRRRNPRVKPAPVFHGGGHERGIRSGTLNVPGIVGLASALKIAETGLEEEASRLRDWTDWMFNEILRGTYGVERNGHPTERLPHNLNTYIPGIESRAVVLEMRNFATFSTGSACSTARTEPSHVIQALGLNEDRSYCSIRFGLGRFNTWEEVAAVAEQVTSTVKRLRAQFAISTRSN